MEAENELAALIDRLKTTPDLSKAKASELFRANFEKAVPAMLGGQTYGQASGGLAILNQSEDAFRSELRSIDNDLLRQIEIVHEALDGWFEKGEIPAPYYAWRVAVILGKARRKDEEAAFLKAWCKHFGRLKGGRFEKLAERYEKIRA